MPIKQLKWHRLRLPELSQRERCMLRFALGVTASMLIAITIDWPLSYLMPIFVGKFLLKPEPLELKAGLILVLIIIATSFLAMLLASLVTVSPTAFLCLIAIFYLNIFYLGTGPIHPLIPLFCILNVTAIPLMVQQDELISSTFTSSFIAGSAGAIVLTWMAFALIPPLATSAPEAAAKKEIPSTYKRSISALISTIIIMPVFYFFYLTNYIEAALVLIFIALLAQNLDLDSTMKGGLILISSNFVGGFIAILFYLIAASAYDLTFYTALFMLFCLWYADKLFSGEKNAAFYAATVTTFILIIGSTTANLDTEAAEKFYTRIFQLSAVVLYMVVMQNLLYYLITRFKLIKMDKL